MAFGGAWEPTSRGFFGGDDPRPGAECDRVGQAVPGLHPQVCHQDHAQPPPAQGACGRTQTAALPAVWSGELTLTCSTVPTYLPI